MLECLVIGMALLEKDKEVWSCWNRPSHAGGSVSVGVGFEFSKGQARPTVTLSSCIFLIKM